MKRHRARLQTLIATLGSEPQVVTIVLDRLLAEGQRIDQVAAVYTAADVVQEAMARLAGEFDGAVYPGVTLRTAPVSGPDGAVEDFRKFLESVAEFREQAWYTGCRIWNIPPDWTQENADVATWREIDETSRQAESYRAYSLRRTARWSDARPSRRALRSQPHHGLA